jgi:hypothetical protein
MLQDPNSASVPDGLVTLRQFVGGLNSALNDQSYAGYDGYAYNPSGQFRTLGPNGAAVEGQPVTMTQSGSVTLSPGAILLVGGALLLVVFLSHQ